MSLAGKCQLKELVLKAEATEVELWAAAQAVVFFGSTSAAYIARAFGAVTKDGTPREQFKVHISLRGS